MQRHGKKDKRKHPQRQYSITMEINILISGLNINISTQLHADKDLISGKDEMSGAR